MKALRTYLGSPLFFIGQMLATLIFSPIAATVGRLYAPIPRARFVGRWADFISWWLRVTCGITYEVEGMENLPDEPSLILANHQSAWETIFFQEIFPAQSQLMKKELMWIPFFGWGLAANLPIVIDRSKKTEAMKRLVEQGRARLEAGRWIVIFPEGTRRPAGEPAPHQAGGAYIASKTSAPVVPVAHNAGLYWPKNSFWKKPGVVKVVVGEAIDPTGKKPREIAQTVENWVNATARKLVTETT